ncbi:hypothetical protein ABL78_5970 [Leptomonas seymouri]|uniref:Ribosome biogenesis protein SLX9 n=1 Tax=Leptomonas seymouri TaxID=5684 RepID=A0A0N0P478_LEPSE|nr:hypothetical protein ABL78_5970 [Leptomonas seymouri]|eukprot:KPI84979.1 hypothetical protein ABL78_5970 [Leptomonas seymouri]
MAGGKSAKRVSLRAKVARKQQVQHAGGEGASASVDSSAAAELDHLSASPSVATEVAEAHRTQSSAPYGHAEGDRETALQIRDALRQRHGRTSRAHATTTTKSSRTSETSSSKSMKATTNRSSQKRQSAKKESKKDASAIHPAELRRAAARERRRLLAPPMSAAEARMATFQKELQLFDEVQTVPAYVEDPFAAVMQHLSSTMDTLKPQTPDIGRAARD